MKKNTKSAGIRKLLKQGYTAREIKNRMAVSESYIHAIKKQMKAGVEAEVETVATKTVIQPSYNPEAGEYIVVEGAKSISEIDAILNERGSRYGNFLDHARITQDIKRAMENSRNWATLPLDTREALEMTAHKIGRMLNGDPEYVDNVVDIIGYMQLVLDRMNGKAERGIST